MTEERQPQDGWLAARSIRLHLLTWGPPTAPPVLMLHGGMQDAHIWDPLARGLADAFRLYALDFPGHGDSDDTPDGRYDHATLAGYLGAALDALHLERFALIGHSLGAHVGIRYEAEHPGTLTRLVIVDVAPDRNPENLKRERSEKMVPLRVRDKAEYLAMAERLRPWRRRELHEHLWRYSFRQDSEGYWVEKSARGFFRGSRDDYTNPVRFAERWEQLRRVTCPTLIIRGALSKVLLPEMAERMVREMRDARLVTIPNAGHSVHFDQAEAVLAVVRPFLHGATHGADPN
jgi:pimeloyl-ACP methyl ester carboxylesterase